MLIRPALTTQINQLGHICLPPISKMYLAAAIRKSHDVMIVESPIEDVASFRVAPSKTFTRIGSSPAKLVEKAVESGADVVGITSEFSQQILDIEEIARGFFGTGSK